MSGAKQMTEKVQKRMYGLIECVYELSAPIFMPLFSNGHARTLELAVPASGEETTHSGGFINSCDYESHKKQPFSFVALHK